jgi:predicted nucleic acid-binding Zn ribbon protein
VAREDLLGDWYGEDVAPLEIETRQAPPQGVGILIDQVLHDLNQGDKVLLRRLLAAWPELVGAAICQVTSPQSIRGKVLYVEVSDATWRFRLQSVIADLNQRVATFSDRQVTSVRLSPGGRTATRP